MKVVILCGGLGTRLREETEFKPKPMVGIGSKPILWHIMKIYSHYGFKDFVICLGYKGEMVKEYFYNYEILNNDFTVELGGKKNIDIHSSHDEDGWRITLADTGDRALKGSRLKQVEKYIDDDCFLMTYGDGVANVNIKALLAFHKSHGKIATVTGVSPASLFGDLRIIDNKVENFEEKSKDLNNMVSGGFFVFNKEIFDYLTFDEDCDLEKEPMKKIAEKGELMVYKHKAFWACMDTYRDVEVLNRLWKEDKADWKIW